MTQPGSTAAGPAHGVVAVLSLHASLAMQLRRAGFDILEGRDVDDLAKAAASVDVVVVDLVRVEGKRGLVARLSTAVDPRVPVVLISADEVDLALLGATRSVQVVVPPVRAEDVIDRVRAILVARTDTEATDSEPGRSGGSVTTLRDVSLLRRSRRKAAERVRGARPDEGPGPARPVNGHPTVAVAARPNATATVVEAGLDPTGDLGPSLPVSAGTTTPGTSVPVPAPGQAGPAVSRRPVKATGRAAGRTAEKAAEKAAAKASAKKAGAAPRKASTSAASAAGAPPTTAGRTPSGQADDLAALPAPIIDWRVLANQLTHAVQGIPSIAVVADVIARELVAASGAHVAVMVRDDAGCWRVEGGAGLRSFEWAQTLEDDHWLVWTGRDQHPSLMVMDTDVVRGELIGAPLASRLQLVRTHSTRASFFVCAGWDDHGTGDDKVRVAQVVDSVNRHSPAMADAMGLRSFALWLNGHVDGLRGIRPQ
jgi:hypothetical protein